MVADVAVGPAVEAAVLHRREIVRRKVIAEPVALVDAGPKLAGGGFEGQAYGIAQTGGVKAGILAVGIANGDGSAAGIALDIDVGFGADADEEMLTVGAEHQGAGGVAAAGKVH